jgi:hypothetical protein
MSLGVEDFARAIYVSWSVGAAMRGEKTEARWAAHAAELAFAVDAAIDDRLRELRKAKAAASTAPPRPMPTSVPGPGLSRAP